MKLSWQNMWGKVVLTEDRETMLYETSIENLRKQLSLKKSISV